MKIINKQNIKIVFLLILLINLSLCPIILLQINSEFMMKNVYKESLPKEDNTEITESQNNKMNRLKIIADSQIEKNSFMDKQYGATFNEEFKNQIYTKIIEQFKILTDKGILPKLELDSQSNFLEFSKLTFFTLSNPNDFVNVWQVGIIYKNFSISVWIDEKTYVLYEIEISVFEGELQSYDQLNSREFFKYLGFLDENIYYKSGIRLEEEYYIGIFKDEKIQYYCIKEKNYICYKIFGSPLKTTLDN